MSISDTASRLLSRTSLRDRHPALDAEANARARHGWEASEQGAKAQALAAIKSMHYDGTGYFRVHCTRS
ncbi:MAG: hypothetical protein H6R00_4896 [Proteobacteria bacterium]|nr:hypothetical protein [Pseudomonadota bacterium]